MRVWVAIREDGCYSEYRMQLLGVWATRARAMKACEHNASITWASYELAGTPMLCWEALPLSPETDSDTDIVEGAREVLGAEFGNPVSNLPLYTVAAYEVEPTTAEEAE